MRKRRRKEEAEAVTICLEENEDIAFDQHVAVGHRSIQGSRETQQDSQGVFVDPERDLTVGVVCDGMGGMEFGELASNLGVQMFCEAVATFNESENIPDRLVKTVKTIDEAVFDLVDEQGKYVISGTTLVGVVIRQEMAYWISVGDSRIFLLRDGELRSLVVEHNYRYLKQLKENDMKFQPSDRIRDDALISYIGKGGLDYIDYNGDGYPLQNGDCFILVSDGVTKTLSQERLLEILVNSQFNAEHMAEKVLEAVDVQQKKHQDNATIVVLKYYGNFEEE